MAEGGVDDVLDCLLAIGQPGDDGRVLASGFRKDERVDSVLNLGANDFIQKPYTIEELSAKVSNVIKA